MKYNALLVPVVALVAVANALPQDASAQAQHGEHPSDQGKYKPTSKSTPPPPSSNIKTTLKDASQAELAKLPIKAPANVPFDKMPSTPLDNVNTNSLPVDKENLPINEKTVEGVEDHLPVDLKKIKLPIEIPPRVPGMRRSRHHVVREAGKKEECGHLRVETGDDKYSGFVSHVRDTNGRYTVVKNVAQGTLVDLQGHNLIFRGEDIYPVLGGTAGVVHDENSAGDDLRGNSANFAMLTGTSMTLYGKAATNGRSSFNDATGAGQKIESAIYSFGENREMHGSWINQDGSSIPGTFGVNADGQIILSANPGQYAATYGGYSAKLFCQ